MKCVLCVDGDSTMRCIAAVIHHELKRNNMVFSILASLQICPGIWRIVG